MILLSETVARPIRGVSLVTGTHGPGARNKQSERYTQIHGHTDTHRNKTTYIDTHLLAQRHKYRHLKKQGGK